MVLLVNEGETTLARGAKHRAVGILQAAINKAGAEPKLSVDGDFGKRTEAAVRSYQIRAPHLTNVYGGIACSRTLEALYILRDVKAELAKSPAPTNAGDWRKGLGIRRFSMGESGINPLTGKREIYRGQAYQLSGYESLIGGRIDLQNKVITFHASDEEGLGAVQENQCALLVQAFGVRETRRWRKGPHVKSCASIPPGTVVATMRDGVYYSDHSGRSHVGIFISKDSAGMTLIDQWNGRSIGRMTRRYKPEDDGNSLVDRGYTKSKTPNITIPVQNPDGSIMGYTSAKIDTFKKYQYTWTGDADEYYVVYDDGTDNVNYV